MIFACSHLVYSKVKYLYKMSYLNTCPYLSSEPHDFRVTPRLTCPWQVHGQTHSVHLFVMLVPPRNFVRYA